MLPQTGPGSVEEASHHGAVECQAALLCLPRSQTARDKGGPPETGQRSASAPGQWPSGTHQGTGVLDQLKS